RSSGTHGISRVQRLTAPQPGAGDSARRVVRVSITVVKLFGPKQMPHDLAPAWEAFQAQAERVEKARTTLLDALPVGRSFPVPVSVGLDVLTETLDAVEPDLPEWRRPEVEQQWLDCAESFGVVRQQIPPARARAGARIGHPELGTPMRRGSIPLGTCC